MTAARVDLGQGTKRHLPPASEADRATSLDRAEVTLQLLEKARQLGFARAGVAHLQPLVEGEIRLEDFLRRGYAGTMGYLAHRGSSGALVRARPASLMSAARSALIVALPYQAPISNDSTKIAAYAQGRDYHIVVREKLWSLADWLARAIGRAVVARACVDSAPLLERDLAERAGIAFLGKNTLAIAPGAGSHFVLGELLLDIDLVQQRPPLPSGCGACTACLEACPTNAFVGPHRLDARRCISYLTIESSGEIPRVLRRDIGERLFGCDACQTVCPYNAAGEGRPVAEDLQELEKLEGVTAEELLALGSSAYKRLVAGTALARASRNQLARNAAVALGNSGRAAAVEPLCRAAQSHASSLVRQHCVWALAELLHHHGVTEARHALTRIQETASRDDDIQGSARTWLDSHAFEEASRPHSASDAHGNEGIPSSQPPELG